MLEMEPRASYTPGKCSVSELHPSPGLGNFNAIAEVFHLFRRKEFIVETNQLHYLLQILS
jgi:hypothetical protein